MISVDSNRFSAAGSALGYLAQVEYALLIALRRMDKEPDLRLSIETVDDITFDSDGSPRELWQTKHHVSRHGGLGDASPDLWKTIHNWIETSSGEEACFLFSTAKASIGSAAYLLQESRIPSDIDKARELLDAVAIAAGNTASSEYYEKYLRFNQKERSEFLSRIVVIDSATTAEKLTDGLLATVRKATIKSRRSSLVERLRGWWHGRAMNHLNFVARGERDWIEMQEIEAQLHQIAQSLRDGNLPLDYEDEREPTPEEASQDDRLFVAQLKLIALHNERIRQAIFDHNRAFLQRSRWQREQLLTVGDLDKYDRRLVEEWRRVFLPLEGPGQDATDDEKRKASRANYGRFQGHPLPPIRTEVQSGYVGFGSLHLLADRLEIGWHPDWVDLLKDRIAEAQGTSQGSEVA